MPTFEDGVTAERRRITGILSLSEAKLAPDIAAECAYRSTLQPAEVRDLILTALGGNSAQSDADDIVAEIVEQHNRCAAGFGGARVMLKPVPDPIDDDSDPWGAAAARAGVPLRK